MKRHAPSPNKNSVLTKHRKLNSDVEDEAVYFSASEAEEEKNNHAGATYFSASEMELEEDKSNETPMTKPAANGMYTIYLLLIEMLIILIYIYLYLEFPCTFSGCTKVFNKRKYLTRHMYTHTGEVAMYIYIYIYLLCYIHITFIYSLSSYM